MAWRFATKMKQNCKQYAVLITGLIDQELDGSERARVDTHLKNCPDCHDKYVAERSIKTLVRERATVARAPDYLTTRVRHMLSRHGERPGFLQLLQSLFSYQPVTSGLVMAALALLMLLPVLYITTAANGPHLDAGVAAAEFSGEIICLDCELLAGRGTRTEHDMLRHRLGIRADDDSVWTFLLTAASMDFVGNHDLLKRRVAVSGTLFQQSHYMQLEHYRLL
jgi:mycothiol system anti-sigma-R factor